MYKIEGPTVELHPSTTVSPVLLSGIIRQVSMLVKASRKASARLQSRVVEGVIPKPGKNYPAAHL